MHFGNIPSSNNFTKITHAAKIPNIMSLSAEAAWNHQLCNWCWKKCPTAARDNCRSSCRSDLVISDCAARRLITSGYSVAGISCLIPAIGSMMSHSACGLLFLGFCAYMCLLRLHVSSLFICCYIQENASLANLSQTGHQRLTGLLRSCRARRPSSRANHKRCEKSAAH